MGLFDLRVEVRLSPETLERIYEATDGHIAEGGHILIAVLPTCTRS
jgi:hypothetical protein